MQRCEYECPCCEEPLDYHDYYGRLCSHQDGKVAGHIFKCFNEECEAQCFYNQYGEGKLDLIEGYPC